MEPSNNKNEIINASMNIIAETIENPDTIDLESYSRVSLTDFASMGAVFSSIPEALKLAQLSSPAGGEGLYRAIIEPGRTLAEAKNMPGLFRGFTSDATGITSHAILEPVNTINEMPGIIPVDPATLCIAVALMSIDKKVDAVKETSEEILQFVTQQTRSRIQGNINVLVETMENYKYNWDNEIYKTNKHQQVMEIKRDAEQSIDAQRKLIEKKAVKGKFIVLDKDVKSKINKLRSDFRDYASALYSFAFASFLEVVLLENFDENYLNNVSNKIAEYADEFRTLLIKVYEIIEKDTGHSIELSALKGLSAAGKTMGTVVSKLPIPVADSLEEKLTGAGEKLDVFREFSIDNTMLKFISDQDDCTKVFATSINSLNTLYNNGVEMIVKDEDVYLNIN